MFYKKSLFKKVYLQKKNKNLFFLFFLWNKINMDISK